MSDQFWNGFWTALPILIAMLLKVFRDRAAEKEIERKLKVEAEKVAAHVAKVAEDLAKNTDLTAQALEGIVTVIKKNGHS